MNITRLPRLSPLAFAAVLSASLLAACGGGGGDSGTDSLSDADAQGYAADSATMPVAAGSAVDSSVAAFSDALTGATANGLQQPQRVEPNATGGTVGCAMAGSVTYTGDTNDNGQFDLGESYSVTFNSCKGIDGNVINGVATLTVTGKTSTSLALTHQTSGLQITTPGGYTWTHNGTTTVTRSFASNTGGGVDYTTHITSTQSSTLTTSLNNVAASYTLNSLDWTVTRSFTSAGTLSGRTHAGTVSIDASTPRRPNATLQITANGSTLGIGSDGLVHNGSFTVVTRLNKLSVTVANNSMTISLDVGNNGSVDRTWTITSYISEAG